ncbi:MAG: hypothetical protein EBY61_06765 [Actinobacteria bacterium]|nr:hypothetical protein [Actinomycetota bacterium]
MNKPMGLLDRLRRRNLTPLDPSFGALIGDLAGPIARIAPDGAVATLDGSWRLEWGVRTGREWKRSSTSAAVRQNRLDDTPVYETWMRVPGGDVIQRSAVVTDGDGRTGVAVRERLARRRRGRRRRAHTGPRPRRIVVHRTRWRALDPAVCRCWCDHRRA